MDFNNRRVTVMGLGNFGGGMGAVQFLVRQGACVTVTDLRSEAELTESLSQLQATPPQVLHLGGHLPSDFTDADLVVVSPAVPRNNSFVQLAQDAGVPVSSEMNLFWELNRAPIVAVTGSNGKSTTTAMTHAILAADGRRTWLGGNIGRSLLPLIDQIQPDDQVVLELSSFQLDDLDRLQRSPQVAIVTNFSANHLDRHGTLENYRTAKQAILRWQSANDIAILNQDDADVAAWQTRGETLFFGLHDSGGEGLFLAADGEALYRRNGQELRFPLRDWLTLPGEHNLSNALAASCAALAMQIPLPSIERGLRGFRALPHRLELVAEVHGRKFFNDSLATTPESAIVALAAFQEPIILLAGGYDKGSDLTEMARAIAAKPAKAIGLMGTTGPRLGELIQQFDPAGRCRRQRCQTFEESFTWAVAQSNHGDVILLSPGCASYDWFRNFADRGNQFRQRAQDAGRLIPIN